jgi:hypothetical protein
VKHDENTCLLVLLAEYVLERNGEAEQLGVRHRVDSATGNCTKLDLATPPYVV